MDCGCNDYVSRADVLEITAETGALETQRRVKELPSVDVRPAISREQMIAALEKYFEIGNSYTYDLTRVKEAFAIGTMSLQDFVEWDSEKVTDLCDYLFNNLLGAEETDDETAIS